MLPLPAPIVCAQASEAFHELVNAIDEPQHRGLANGILLRFLGAKGGPYLQSLIFRALSGRARHAVNFDYTAWTRQCANNACFTATAGVDENREGSLPRSSSATRAARSPPTKNTASAIHIPDNTGRTPWLMGSYHAPRSHLKVSDSVSLKWT